MEKRIIKLETETEMIKAELNSYSDALKENTKSIQELTKIMVRHDEMLRQDENDDATRNAIITGIVVGVVVFLVTEFVHLI
jgi:predicted NUDIX family phosphoesterase